MATITHSRSLTFLSVLVVLLACAGDAQAHVILDAPNGGEVLIAGTTFVISWHIQISHNLQNWDLWYSTTGAAGPWLPIATNLFPGSSAAGSVHAFVWTVPATPSSQVRVRVRMDNSVTDYLDVSNANLTIALPLTANTPNLSLSTGGVQMLSLTAGSANAGRTYVLAGSLSGTSPGLSLGIFLIPLNQDLYFTFTVTNPNTFPLSGSLGTLDATGAATATFTLPPGLPQSLGGTALHHAYVLLGASVPITLISNAQSLTLTP